MYANFINEQRLLFIVTIKLSDMKYICYAFLFIQIILCTQYYTYLIKIKHKEDGKHIPQMLKTYCYLSV